MALTHYLDCGTHFWTYSCYTLQSILHMIMNIICDIKHSIVRENLNEKLHVIKWYCSKSTIKQYCT